MFETVLASLGLLACLVIWLGMALGPARRHRLQSWWRQSWWSLRRGRQAQREARNAIERARRHRGSNKVERDGNVLRPDSFRQRKDDDETLH